MLGVGGSTTAYAMGGLGSAQVRAAPVERTNGVIYVGDSRFNGMEMYLGKGGEFVIAKDSMGYNWLVNQAAYRIAAVKQAHPEVTQWRIVSGLGVNDICQADRYIQAYRAFKAAGDKVIAMSVNPSYGKRDSMNKEINDFNTKQANSGLDYFDMNSHLWKVGFLTVDGLHYSKSTYLEIWNELNHYIWAERDRHATAAQEAAGAVPGRDAGSS